MRRSFLDIQTQTGWGRTLRNFATWCRPEPGWQALDVGSGPGLLPALLAEAGCHAMGVDLDYQVFHAQRLHGALAQADARWLPFCSRSFDLVTACNLLFMLDNPVRALVEMARLLAPDGQICLLNPSERLSVAAALELAEQRGLRGLSRWSLLNWAQRAEAHQRWTKAEIANLCQQAGLELVETAWLVGPGFARLARARLR